MAGIYVAKELEEFFKYFSVEVKTKMVRKATRAAAVVIQKEAKNKAPNKTGNLKNSIRVVKRRSENGHKLDKDEVMYSVLPKTVKRTKVSTLSDGTKWKIKGTIADGWYAHFIEYGTENKRGPKPKGKKTTYKVSKPIRAKPFLAPAVISSMDSSYARYKEVLSKDIDKYLKQKGLK